MSCQYTLTLPGGPIYKQQDMGEEGGFKNVKGFLEPPKSGFYHVYVAAAADSAAYAFYDKSPNSSQVWSIAPATVSYFISAKHMDNMFIGLFDGGGHQLQDGNGDDIYVAINTGAHLGRTRTKTGSLWLTAGNAIVIAQIVDGSV